MGRRRDDDDEAVSAFARVMQERGRRPHRVIPMPGLEGVRVAIMCPTEGELTTADVEARKHLTKGLGLNALELSLAQETELSRRERELQLLALILRDADDPDSAFVESVDELREDLEEPQRKGLMAAMEDFRRERYEARTPEESERIVELVRDLKVVGALSTYWMSCDPDSQLSIVHALVEACAKQTVPSSSDTSPSPGQTTT
ncbi:MAG: hypothetical protein R3A48_28985 [Polyangiales bacterium]